MKCIVIDMGAVNPDIRYQAEEDRKHELAEADRKSFLHVVVAAGIALVVVFVIALIVLWALGQKGIPLDHRHKEANAEVHWPTTPRAEMARIPERIAI